MLAIRPLVLLLLILPAMPLRAFAPPLQTHDAQVVLRIAPFDEDAHARLAREIGRMSTVTLEYACLWTGVVVVKYTDVSVGDRADVMTYTRRLLQAAGIEQGIEFLHIHVEPKGSGKC